MQVIYKGNNELDERKGITKGKKYGVTRLKTFQGIMTGFIKNDHGQKCMILVNSTCAWLDWDMWHIESL